MEELNKERLDAMQLLIAVRIMGYYPRMDKGMYSFVEGNIRGSVQFEPLLRLHDCLSVLERLTAIGWDYSVNNFTNQRKRRTLPGLEIVDDVEVILTKGTMMVREHAQTWIDAICMAAFKVAKMMPKMDAEDWFNE